jgi:hypothetical protein
MRKAILFLLSFSLIMAITLSEIVVNNSSQSTRQAAVLSDETSNELIGRGSNAKKFVNGVLCGAGGVLIIAGFAGGLFSGGLTAVIAGAALGAQTATACVDAF